MDCADVQKLLSPFVDGELPGDVAAQVGRHVADCQVCTEEADFIRDLAEAVREWPEPVPPADLWERIEPHASASKPQKPAGSDSTGVQRLPAKARLPWVMMRLVAATVLVASFVWMGRLREDDAGASGKGRLMPDASAVRVLERYATLLPHAPEAAEAVLLTSFGGRRLPVRARKAFARSVAERNDLREDYTLASVSVVEMPCCRCLHVLCRRSDGSGVAVIERVKEGTTGDWSPAGRCPCDPCCCLSSLDELFCIRGRSDAREVLVLGARNRHEADRLVAWFDRHAVFQNH